MAANGRQIYETEADLNRERKVLDAISRHFDLDYRVMPKCYGYDAELMEDGRVCAIVEVKCRNITWDRYPTFLLCAEKYSNLRRIARSLRVRGLLVVNWTDRLGYWDVTDRPIQTHRIGGRTDRNDTADIGPVINIHNTNFSFVQLK